MLKNLEFKNFNDFNFLKDSKINEINEWFDELKNKKNIKKMEKKIILVTSNNCNLKTSFARFLLSNYKYTIDEYNAIDMRGDKSIKDFLNKIIYNKNIINIFKNLNDNRGLILDNIDTNINSNDKSIITEILGKILDKKDKSIINIPIIIICINSSEKKINELKKIALNIEIPKLKSQYYQDYLSNLLNINNIDIQKGYQKKIVSYSGNNFRVIYNIIEILYSLSDFKLIDKNLIDNAINIFFKNNKKNKVIKDFEKIFETKLDINECINMFYSEKFLYPFLIHENYIYFINNDNIKFEDALIYLNNITNNLSKNDIIQNLIFEKQLWDLNNCSAILTTVRTSIESNKIVNKYKDIKIKLFKQKYTTLLNKVSLYYTNRKVYNKLLNKFGIQYIDIYLLSELIVKLIINKNIKFSIDSLKYIVKKYKIGIEYIDLLIRVYKFDTIDIKKFYTCKLKSEIKNELKN